MELELDLTKTPEQNAEVYFEKAKKARRKIDGIETAISSAKKRLENLEQEEKERIAREEQRKEKEDKKEERKAEWYEKFRWFFSSEGFLVVGGRDATSNDIIVRKHMEKDEFVFHTNIPGSPFVVIKKQEDKEVGEETIHEAALFCASYSRAWKLGIGTTEVYMIKGEQVKKELGLPKGTFMIYGKRRYFKPIIGAAIGVLDDGRVMGGPLAAVKALCKKYVEVVQGNEKTAALAKGIRAKIGGDLDDIIKVIPAGGARLKSSKR